MNLAYGNRAYGSWGGSMSRADATRTEVDRMESGWTDEPDRMELVRSEPG